MKFVVDAEFVLCFCVIL